MADWQPGDLALCVKQGPWIASDTDDDVSGPKAGEINEVVDVHIYDEDDAAGPDFAGVFLVLSGWDYECFGDYHAERFRKVTPGADIEGFEERRRLPVKEDV